MPNSALNLPFSPVPRRSRAALAVMMALLAAVLVACADDRPVQVERCPAAGDAGRAGEAAPDGNRQGNRQSRVTGALAPLAFLLPSDEADEWDATFDDSTSVPYGNVAQEGNGSAAEVTVQSAPEAGGRALKMSMPPSAGAEANRPNRKLLSVPDFSWRSGDEYWYGIRLYFDETWQLDDVRDDRGQFVSLVSFRYADAGAGNGTGSIKLVPSGDGGACLVHTRAALSTDEFGDGAGEDPLYLGKVVKGEWIDLVCHFKWSHTSENALKECWRNGQLMGRSTRRNMTVDAPVIQRVGIYQGTAVDHERTLWWDNHRIGDSYEAVDPSDD